MGSGSSREEGAGLDPNVKTLVVSGKNLNSDDYKALTESLKYNRSVGRVDLASLRIGPARLRELAKSLNENPSVTAVSLKDNVVCADGGKALSEVVIANNTVKTLVLEGNDAGSAGCKVIAEGLMANITLTELDLSRNMIGPDGIKALADVFRTNQTLRVLNVSHNWAGVDGCQAFADALKNFARLAHLNISSNEIGDDGARMLANALKFNRTLTKLELGGNLITVDGCDDVADGVETNFVIQTILFGGKEDKVTKSKSFDRLQRLLERNRLRGPELVAQASSTTPASANPASAEEIPDNVSMRSFSGSTLSSTLEDRQQLTLTFNGQSRSIAISSRSDAAAIEKAVCLMFGKKVGTPMMVMDTSSCVLPVDGTLRTGLYTVMFAAE